MILCVVKGLLYISFADDNFPESEVTDVICYNKLASISVTPLPSFFRDTIYLYPETADYVYYYFKVIIFNNNNNMFEKEEGAP